MYDPFEESLRDLLKSSYFARLTDSLGNWVLAPVIGLIAGCGTKA